MLFNTAGYRVAFSFLEKNSSEKLNLAIDEGNFDQQNLIEIQIPLNMPYYSDKGYEVAYGETEMNGQHYQYVKRKVSNNTLYLLCLPNNDKSKLVAAKNNIENSTIELNNNKSNQKNSFPALSKSLQQEYIQNNSDFNIINGSLAEITLPQATNINAGDLFTPLTASQPPERCG